MAATRLWAAAAALVLLSATAFAQDPPQGDPKAECDYWLREVGRGTTVEARQAAGRKALDAARRTGDPERLQTVLWDMHYQGLDPTGEFGQQAVELGLRPDATGKMWNRAIGGKLQLSWEGADPEGKDPDLRARIMREWQPEALALNPNWPFEIQYAELGRYYSRAGRLREACEWAHRSIEANPGYETPWSYLVAWYREMGELELSLHAFYGQVRLWPKGAGGRVSAATYDLGVARNQATMLPRQHVPRSIRTLGVERYFAGHMSDLQAMMRRSLDWPAPTYYADARRTIAECHIVLAAAHAQRGDMAEAEEALAQAEQEAALAAQTAIDTDRNDELPKCRLVEAEADEAWGELLLAESRLEEAEAKLGEAIQSRQEIGDTERALSPRPFGLYAQVKYLRGKVAEAIALEEQALKAAEGAEDVRAQAEALSALSVLYLEAGRSGEGARAGEKASELARGLDWTEAEEVTRQRLAELYYLLGDVEEAEAIEQGMRRVGRGDTGDWGAALRRRAQSAYRGGDFAGAIRLLRQARKLDETLGRKVALVDDLNGLAACYLGRASGDEGPELR